jgi:hypothetical protein
MLGLLRVWHMAHLVGDGLQPRLVRLDQCNHLGQSGKVW